MCSTRDNVALPTLGFPIRESPGQWLFSASPGLIAAVHALHRLLVPRHPPCALNILTVISGRALRLRPVIPVSLATVQFSRSGKRCDSRAQARDQVRERRRRAGLSKLNSMRCNSLERIALRRNLRVTPRCLHRCCADFSRYRLIRRYRQARSTLLGRSREAIAAHNGLPRKEVIQPQLPLRLPCYDFTPVASPTFDGSLPKGLGHRLRVLLTPMV